MATQRESERERVEYVLATERERERERGVRVYEDEKGVQATVWEKERERVQ